MTCDDKKPLVHALADGELDVVHAREIEAHIASCANCAESYAEIMSLKQRLATAGLRLQAPAGLAERILQALPSPEAVEEPVRRPVRVRQAWWRAPANAWRLRLQGALAGGAGAFALAACLAFFVMRADTGNEIARSLVDGHLRSLAGQHLFDVQSTDQHTVKPWFAGKLDVTPPVPDLALKGFTLVGGRVDYVEGRAAAVVVYRRRTHVINLFVWPGTDPAPPSIELSGYMLRHWTKDGLTFWAVSDIAGPELGEFAEAYRAAT
ncbi:MAG: anti-sigma factor [Hyphomicrobiales bacterium]|nr:anti-sigma factor [Hyphomicrobiales bacterium]